MFQKDIRQKSIWFNMTGNLIKRISRDPVKEIHWLLVPFLKRNPIKAVQ